MLRRRGLTIIALNLAPATVSSPTAPHTIPCGQHRSKKNFGPCYVLGCESLPRAAILGRIPARVEHDMYVSMSLRSPMKGVMRHAHVKTDSRVWEDACDEEEEVGLVDAVIRHGLR